MKIFEKHEKKILFKIIDNYIFNLEDMCDNLGRKIAKAYPYKNKNEYKKPQDNFIRRYEDKFKKL